MLAGMGSCLKDYVASICDGHTKTPENMKAAATGGKCTLLWGSKPQVSHPLLTHVRPHFYTRTVKAKKADNKVDKMFAGTPADKFFKVTERGSNLTTEVRAGFTTFLTAAYISAPRITRTRDRTAR